MPGYPIDLFIDCVLLTSFGSEFTFLRNILKFSGIRMHRAESVEEADFLLTVTAGTVLLADAQFDGGSWEGAARMLRDGHPLVTLLVVADGGDQSFLAGLFPAGACGVLWRPFDFDTVRRRIRAVHEAARERRLLRDELETGGGVLLPFAPHRKI